MYLDEATRSEVDIDVSVDHSRFTLRGEVWRGDDGQPVTSTLAAMLDGLVYREILRRS